MPQDKAPYNATTDPRTGRPPLPIDKEANKPRWVEGSSRPQSAEAGMPEGPEAQSTIPAMKAKPELDKGTASQPDTTAALEGGGDAEEGKNGASRP